MTRRLLPVLLTGCGRLAFEGTPAGDAGETAFDAPSSDGSPDAAGPCLSGNRVCDGFEGPAFAPLWSLQGNVTLDGTVAHRGTQSVRFRAAATVPTVDNYARLTETTTLPLGDPVLFVRAWVRLGAIPLNNMGLIAGVQMIGGGNEVAVFVLPDALGVYTQFVEQTRHNNTIPPTNTWFCIVWQVARATTSNGALYLSGDQPPAQIVNVQTDGVPALRVLDLGIQLAGSTNTVPQAAFDVWMDDLIVSPTQVSCAD